MKKSMLVVLIVALIVSAMPFGAVFAQDIPTDNLVAYWNFDSIENGVVSDMSGNGFDMTVDDTSYDMISGKSGSSINFNGSGFDETGHMSMNAKDFVDRLNGSEAITITGFVKKESLGHGANQPIIRLLTGNDSIKLNVTSTSGNDEKMTLAARSITADAFGNVNKNFPVKYACKNGWSNACGWNAFAVVIKYGQSTSIYWDGNLVSTQAVTHNSNTFAYTGADAHKLYLCAATASIDELKIYNTGLTEDQIETAAGTAIEYDFEDPCNGIKDISGNGADVNATSVEVIEGEGLTGKAAKINAPLNLTVPSAILGSLRGASKVSFSAWIKLNESTLPAADGTYLLKGITSSKNDAFVVKINKDGKIAFGLRTINTDAFGGWTSSSSLFANDKSDWHHIGFVVDYSTKTGSIYFDGRLDTQSTISNDKVLSNGFINCDILAKSATNYDTLGCADGISMESLKIYRRALDEAEIKALAQDVPFAAPEFSVDGTTVTAKVKLANQTGETIAKGDITAILAVYDKERDSLAAARVVGAEELKAGARDELTLTVEDIAAGLNGQYAKLFVWDKFETMVPYIEATTYPQN